MANLVFIANTASKGSTGVTLELEDIPQNVREEVEQAYEALKTNPGRFRAEFASLAELTTYVSQVTAYCALRPAGAIRFRKSPTRGLPPTTMDFRITELATPNEQATEEVRTAVENVKTAAAKK